MEIIRSYREYLYGIKQPQSKKCLALCHGHYHSTKMISQIRGECYWYMVDNNPECCPDLICDVSDIEAMAYFPDQSFDVIMSLYFPGGASPQKYTDMLNIIRRILKPGGKIYLSEAQGTFLWFSSIEEKLSFQDCIIDIIGFEHWNKFVSSISSGDQFAAVRRILCHSYFGEFQEELRELVDETRSVFAIKYLQRLNYSVIKYKEFFVLQLQ